MKRGRDKEIENFKQELETLKQQKTALSDDISRLTREIRDKEMQVSGKAKQETVIQKMLFSSSLARYLMDLDKLKDSFDKLSQITSVETEFKPSSLFGPQVLYSRIIFENGFMLQKNATSSWNPSYRVIVGDKQYGIATDKKRCWHKYDDKKSKQIATKINKLVPHFQKLISVQLSFRALFDFISDIHKKFENGEPNPLGGIEFLTE
jgi:hypothetical protein